MLYVFSDRNAGSIQVIIAIFCINMFCMRFIQCVAVQKHMS